MDWGGVVVIVVVLLVGVAGGLLHRRLDGRFRDVADARRRLADYVEGSGRRRAVPEAASSAAANGRAGLPDAGDQPPQPAGAPPAPAGRPVLRLVRDSDAPADSRLPDAPAEVDAASRAPIRADDPHLAEAGGADAADAGPARGSGGAEAPDGARVTADARADPARGSGGAEALDGARVTADARADPARGSGGAEAPDGARVTADARAEPGVVEAGDERLDADMLAGLGVRPAQATLLQFSSAFCAPCRAVRRVSAEVAALLPGVQHVEVDAESHLAEVRALGIWRTPTLLLLDSGGRVAKRATGVPSKPQLIAALAEVLPRR